MCRCNLAFLAKNRNSAIMVMVPQYMMVQSQVAVLLPVGAVRSMCLNIHEMGKRASTIALSIRSDRGRFSRLLFFFLSFSSFVCVFWM